MHFFRAICYDWSDTDCRNILGNTAQAMKRDHSRLLISDHVLPNTGGNLNIACQDIMMMSVVGGMERAERQWRELLEAIGSDIVKIWTAPGVEAVIECVLKG